MSAHHYVTLTGGQGRISDFHFINTTAEGMVANNTTLNAGDMNNFDIESTTIVNSALNDSTANNVNLTNSDLKDSHIHDATITGDLIPTADEAYDLGSPDAKFRDLYLSGSSVHLGTGTLKVQDAIGTFEMFGSVWKDSGRFWGIPEASSNSEMFTYRWLHE